MVARNLKAWVEDLHQTLKRDTVAYRALVSDRKTHVFGISQEDLVHETVKQLGSSGQVKVPVNLIQITKINELAATYFERITAAIKSEADSTSFDGTVFLATFEGREGGPNITEKVKKSYSISVEEYLNEVKKLFSNEKLNKVNLGSFFHLGHLEQSEVFETKIAEVFRTSKNTTSKLAVKRWETLIAKSTTKVDLSAVLNNTTGVVHVTLEAAAANQIKGQLRSTFSKQLNKDLLRILALEAPNIINLRGSDTIKEAHRKKSLKAVTDPLAKIKSKRVKLNIEDTKIKKSSNQPKTKRITTKTKVTPIIPRDPKTGRFISKKTVDNLNPTALRNIINAKLPEYVARNMGSPRLNYISGRFAESTRIADVRTNQDGSPSIGYTYQLYPYQTFEPGYAQGSPERDPRPLIDLSIRQILASLQLKRFTTRRV